MGCGYIIYDKGGDGMTTIVCKVCGKEFERKTSAQKYCSEKCRNDAYYEKYKSPYNKKEEKKIPSLIEMNRLAKEQGMTYGQYVATLYKQSQMQAKQMSCGLKEG